MFYGWRIVGVAFLTNFVSVGLTFYSYGVFFKALAEEFGGSRLGVATGLTIFSAVTAVCSPFLGRALDRGPIRVIMCAGAVVLATGFLLVSRVTQLWQFYALLGLLIATGSAMLGGLASSTLVSNWFVARRGTALGVSAVGISLSGVVMAPAATTLIAELGWRATYAVYAGAALVLILPAVWLVVVNRPEEIGMRPDGASRDVDASSGPPPVLPLAPGAQLIDYPPERQWSARGSLRDRNFWAIAGAVAFNFGANGAILTHLIPHATDIGIEPLRAAWALSAAAGMGVVGKLCFGWLVDRIDKRAAIWLATGLQAIGLALLMRAVSYPALITAAGVFGLGMGGLVPMWGALVGAAFGRHAFGRVMGLMSPVMLPVQMAGIPFAGWVFDRYASYDLAFAVLLGFYAVAMAVLGLLRLPAEEVE